jgi:hypothetical protein
VAPLGTVTVTPEAIVEFLPLIPSYPEGNVTDVLIVWLVNIMPLDAANCVALKSPSDGLYVSLVLDTVAVENVPLVAVENVG